MSDLVMALNTLGQTITSALQASGITGVSGAGYRGWPTATELAKVIAQDKGQSQFTLWPLKGRRTTAYSPDGYLLGFTPPAPQLQVLISSDFTTLTVLHAPGKGDNLHAFFAKPTWDAQVGPAAGTETITAWAASTAAAVNNLAVPGVSAAPSGANVVLTGALWAYANVGGTGSMTMEVAREARSVQCSIWCPNPTVRDAMGTAIIANVGGTNNPRLQMADGNQMMCLYDTDLLWDKAQSSYSVLRWDIFFDIEYPITQTIGLVQVEGFVVSQSIDGVAEPILRFGEA